MINEDIKLDKLNFFCTDNNIETYVLRLDKVHESISGNKWFKLKHHLSEAILTKKKGIITFGGAFSNHIVATACACKLLDMHCIGIVRGEQPKSLSHTLQHAINFGMELIFTSRDEYKQKNIPSSINQSDYYIIPEGGYGILGAKGIAEILQKFNTNNYTHIITACGTGTTLAGAILSSSKKQKVFGINALKGYENIISDIKKIIPLTQYNNQIHIFNDYHFNGYAKYNQELLCFMNSFYTKENIETDFVYTAKMFYALNDLCKKKYIESESKILAIHTGGLQGNLSLPHGTLVY